MLRTTADGESSGPGFGRWPAWLGPWLAKLRLHAIEPREARGRPPTIACPAVERTRPSTPSVRIERRPSRDVARGSNNAPAARPPYRVAPKTPTSPWLKPNDL